VLIGPSATARSPRGNAMARILARAIRDVVPRHEADGVIETLRDMLALAYVVHRYSWVSATIFAREAVGSAMRGRPPLVATLARLDAPGVFLVIACRAGVHEARGQLDSVLAQIAFELAATAPDGTSLSTAVARSRVAFVDEYGGLARCRTWLRARTVRELHRLDDLNATCTDRPGPSSVPTLRAVHRWEHRALAAVSQAMTLTAATRSRR
jgi:hypothetical protein